MVRFAKAQAVIAQLEMGYLEADGIEACLAP
jgi:hypothetical protein